MIMGDLLIHKDELKKASDNNFVSLEEFYDLLVEIDKVKQ